MTTGRGKTNTAEVIESLTRKVADFPQPGVHFKDLTPLFADPDGWSAVTEALAEIASGADLVAGIDSRGLLVAASTATSIGTGVLTIRKGGKLPPPVLREHYEMEYGKATLEIPADGIDLTGRDVVLIDDVLATGGTLGAASRLLQRVGANIITAVVLVELTSLGGREAVAPLQVRSLSQV